MSQNDSTTHKGPSLARSPVLIIGALLAGWGLVLFLKQGNTPTGTFPDGTQNGAKFLGFEVNGWTAWFTVAAGALLLFGAAQHVLAKTFALVVGLALGACSVIALWDGDDVLGLAAANGPDKLLWGAAAAALLVVALLPRGRDKEEDTPTRVVERPVAAPRAERTVREESVERPATVVRPSQEDAVRTAPARVADQERAPGSYVGSDRELPDGANLRGNGADGGSVKRDR